MMLTVPGIVMNTAKWLVAKGAICAVSLNETDHWQIDYSYQGRIWPPLTFKKKDDGNVAIMWPKGTDFDLMMSFLFDEYLGRE